MVKNKQQIKIIGFDIDGTLTDGQIHFTESGEVLKIFNAKDGFGIRKALKNNLKVCFITGRKANQALINRIIEWGIDPKEFLRDATHNKLEVAKEFLVNYKFSLEEMAYMGDDLPDLELLEKVGLSACPVDAIKQVKFNVDFVSEFSGGRGAARDFIDYLLD